MPDKRPSPPQWKWFSICSRHRDYDATCDLCNAGHWENSAYEALNHWLYTHDPELWRKWANRPGSDSTKFLESIFPNMRHEAGTQFVAVPITFEEEPHGAGPFDTEEACERWIDAHQSPKRSYQILSVHGSEYEPKSV